MNEKGDDICKCGHLRRCHNNRIMPKGEDSFGSYVSQFKYNCCLCSNQKPIGACKCQKFRIKE